MNVVFDFDGCLVYSLDVQKKAYYESYKEVVGDDKCPSFEEYYTHTGDTIGNVFRIMNFPEEMIDVYRRICTENIPLNKINKDAIELIKKYKAKGWKFGLCTGKDRFRTIDILNYNGLQDFFDAVICAEDVDESKPSPKPLLKTMEAMGATVKDTLYVGDGYNDLMTAKNANVISILSTWYGDVGVKRDCNYIATTIEDLDKIFKNY